MRDSRPLVATARRHPRARRATRGSERRGGNKRPALGRGCARRSRIVRVIGFRAGGRRAKPRSIAVEIIRLLVKPGQILRQNAAQKSCPGPYFRTFWTNPFTLWWALLGAGVSTHPVAPLPKIGSFIFDFFSKRSWCPPRVARAMPRHSRKICVLEAANP